MILDQEYWMKDCEFVSNFKKSSLKVLLTFYYKICSNYGLKRFVLQVHADNF